MLESVYRAEEHVIQTELYYRASNGAMPVASGAMVAAHTLVLGLVLQRCPVAAVPFFAIRLCGDAFGHAFTFT